MNHHPTSPSSSSSAHFPGTRSLLNLINGDADVNVRLAPHEVGVYVGVQRASSQLHALSQWGVTPKVKFHDFLSNHACELCAAAANYCLGSHVLLEHNAAPRWLCEAHVSAQSCLALEELHTRVTVHTLMLENELNNVTHEPTANIAKSRREATTSAAASAAGALSSSSSSAAPKRRSSAGKNKKRKAQDKESSRGPPVDDAPPKKKRTKQDTFWLQVRRLIVGRQKRYIVKVAESLMEQHASSYVNVRDVMQVCEVIPREHFSETQAAFADRKANGDSPEDTTDAIMHRNVMIVTGGDSSNLDLAFKRMWSNRVSTLNRGSWLADHHPSLKVDKVNNALRFQRSPRSTKFKIVLRTWPTAMLKPAQPAANFAHEKHFPGTRSVLNPLELDVETAANVPLSLLQNMRRLHYELESLHTLGLTPTVMLNDLASNHVCEVCVMDETAASGAQQPQLGSHVLLRHGAAPCWVCSTHLEQRRYVELEQLRVCVSERMDKLNTDIGGTVRTPSMQAPPVPAGGGMDLPGLDDLPPLIPPSRSPSSINSLKRKRHAAGTPTTADTASNKNKKQKGKKTTPQFWTQVQTIVANFQMQYLASVADALMSRAGTHSITASRVIDCCMDVPREHFSDTRREFAARAVTSTPEAVGASIVSRNLFVVTGGNGTCMDGVFRSMCLGRIKKMLAKGTEYRSTQGWLQGSPSAVTVVRGPNNRLQFNRVIQHQLG